jgi:hypothetical protein
MGFFGDPADDLSGCVSGDDHVVESADIVYLIFMISCVAPVRCAAPAVDDSDLSIDTAVEDGVLVEGGDGFDIFVDFIVVGVGVIAYVDETEVFLIGCSYGLFVEGYDFEYLAMALVGVDDWIRSRAGRHFYCQVWSR